MYNVQVTIENQLQRIDEREVSANLVPAGV